MASGQITIYIYIYVYIYVCIYMRMCHHPRTYPLILVGVAQQRAIIPMCHHDFFRLLGPGRPLSDLGTHNALISGRAIVCLDPNLWGRLAYFMNNPNCTPSIIQAARRLRSLQTKSSKGREAVAPALGHARVVDMFHDVSEILTEVWEFSRHVDDTYPTPKSGIEGRRHA